MFNLCEGTQMNYHLDVVFHSYSRQFSDSRLEQGVEFDSIALPKLSFADVVDVLEVLIIGLNNMLIIEQRCGSTVTDAYQKRMTL
jgi:hypothetical protein